MQQNHLSGFICCFCLKIIIVIANTRFEDEDAAKAAAEDRKRRRVLAEGEFVTVVDG